MFPRAHTRPTVILFGMNYDTNIYQSPRDLGSNSKFSLEAPPSCSREAFFDNSLPESLTRCSTHHPKSFVSLCPWLPHALFPTSTRAASSRGLSGGCSFYCAGLSWKGYATPPEPVISFSEEWHCPNNQNRWPWDFGQKQEEKTREKKRY